MRKYMIGVWHPSVILTYCNAIFSVFGICLLKAHPTLAVVFLVCAALCDMFDGMVANCFERSEHDKLFGVQIDSLADTCSFVAFPAYILVHLCGYSVWSYIVAALFTVMGIARLSWFNITTGRSPGYFTGIPVTSSAIIVPVIYAILGFLKLPATVNQVIWCVSLTVTAVLFVCNFKLRKPNFTARMILLAAAIVLIAVLFITL